ncbi:MAG: hypothetical protein QXT45_00795 [Candidatus Bilamarchaeaceae archaeon]
MDTNILTTKGDKMNAIEMMSSINRFGKYITVFVLLVGFLIIPAYSQGSQQLQQAMHDLCVFAQQLLGVAIMLMIILAAIVYAVGQIMGAETRARATVWATSMLTGAVIGVLIYLLTPWLIGIMMSGQTGWTGTCEAGGGGP